MKKYFPKTPFSVLSYDRNTFARIRINFELKYYNLDKENSEYVYINNTVFRKNENKNDTRYLYDYFYSQKELRNLKIQKINESR